MCMLHFLLLYQTENVKMLCNAEQQVTVVLKKKPRQSYWKIFQISSRWLQITEPSAFHVLGGKESGFEDQVADVSDFFHRHEWLHEKGDFCSSRASDQEDQKLLVSHPRNRNLLLLPKTKWSRNLENGCLCSPLGRTPQRKGLPRLWKVYGSWQSEISINDPATQVARW